MMLLNLFFAVLAGVATAFQPGMNSKFAEFAGHRIHGGVINFAVGLLTMLLVWAVAARALGAPVPVGSRLLAGPAWMWFGGVLGAFFVTTAVVLTPKVGTSNYLAALIAGQLLASLIIDHYGLMGLKQMNITPTRTGGALLILAGMACIKWG